MVLVRKKISIFLEMGIKEDGEDRIYIKGGSYLLWVMGWKNRRKNNLKWCKVKEVRDFIKVVIV